MTEIGYISLRFSDNTSSMAPPYILVQKSWFLESTSSDVIRPLKDTTWVSSYISFWIGQNLAKKLFCVYIWSDIRPLSVPFLFRSSAIWHLISHVLDRNHVSHQMIMDRKEESQECKRWRKSTRAVMMCSFKIFHFLQQQKTGKSWPPLNFQLFELELICFCKSEEEIFLGLVPTV